MHPYYNATRRNMEDDLNIFENGRRPQFFFKGRRPQLFEMEDDLNFFQMEDDLKKMTSI